ncbi:MAG: YqgE/AlgH family protein [Roseicyclus sp.]|jgi:putative transcriptional regulator|nr:YqgE/AlgH family protein [Roseicyclus sp.]
MTDASARPEDLTGKLLIAMPDMGDPRFHGSVVFLCAHSGEGAMGLIVNKPMPDVGLGDLLDQLEIARGPATPDLSVCFGGPVELRRGFVLHSAEYHGDREERLEVDDRFAMTATLDVLEDIARGTGPERALLALGYAGWGPGQLEGEIRENGWLTAEATPEIVFAPRMEGKWAAALASLGISPLTLSSEAGHA